MKESKFQQSIKKQLESQGAFVIKLHGEAFQINGLPDLLVLHPRWTGFLELKTEKGKCSAIQRIIAAKIKLRGTPCYVLRCVEINTEVFIYQLENFEGKIIKEHFLLDELLNILQKLELESKEICNLKV